MKTEWDYTGLAEAYLKRPDYSGDAIDKLFTLAKTPEKADVCDVGAGVAHLTLHLARRGFRVVAVEPNDAMRALGRKRTQEFRNVEWFEGAGERTGQKDGRFQLVTFGSSFNVTDRAKALAETNRILAPKGWFACMWNHRELKDPTQAAIEKIIGDRVAGYDYGTRREDQTAVIEQSGLFEKVHKIEGNVVHQVSVDDCVEAWRSHATLQRQAGDKFVETVDAIEKYLRKLGTKMIPVPYVTHIWVSRRNS